MPRRVCTFAVAHTDLSGQPFNNAGRTLRVLAPNNLGGCGLYVKFSNYYSARPVWTRWATFCPVPCAPSRCTGIPALPWCPAATYTPTG